MSQTIKIGTRGSPLALWQAEKVRDELLINWPELAIELVVIQTSGDWTPAEGEVRLSVEVGGKAQFAKEIEEALLAGAIDLAVHSMKDMDSNLPKGLGIACMLPREDARDAILLRTREGEFALKSGQTVGTVSVRRQAALLAMQPDLKFVPLRGNVGTRISKLRGDLAANHPDLDMTMLAVAGLKRLGMEAKIDHIIEVDDMLPAAAQGAIGIEVLANNGQLKNLLAPLNCTRTQMRVEAERGVLSALGGSCHTPIGVYAEFDSEGAYLTVRACLYSLDGQQQFEDFGRAIVVDVQEAIALGHEIGERMKGYVPVDILQQQAVDAPNPDVAIKTPGRFD